MNTERQAHYTPGARFFTDDLTGELMFEYVIDGGNKVGPRVATDADIEGHKSALADMEARAKAAVDIAKGDLKQAEKDAAATSSAKGEVEKRAKEIEKAKMQRPPSKPVESDDHKKLREEQTKKR